MSNHKKNLLFDLQILSADIDKNTSKFPIRNVYCVGRNYTEHALEMGAHEKEEPFFFTKLSQSITHNKIIQIPEDTQDFQYEIELVTFIGKKCRNIKSKDSSKHIFGYSVGIDLTKRDLQKIAKNKGRPWSFSKAFDFSAPISKIKIIEDCSITNNKITLRKNGKLLQNARVSDMIWSIDEIVSKLSKKVTLFPGDLIFSGTPSGVGRIMNGDHIEAVIENIGKLEVTFI